MLFGRESAVIAENTPYVISPELVHGVKAVDIEFFKGVFSARKSQGSSAVFQKASTAVRFPVQSERYKKMILV